MKKRVFPLLVLLLAAVLFVPVTASADMGPKRSVTVHFKNMGSELCRATLLSRSDHSGPAQAWDGRPESVQSGDPSDAVWRAFADYRDPDGYYFLQMVWTVSESGSLRWGYWPPSDFKILLYFPEADVFLSSGPLSQYAFDTQYTVDLEGRGSAHGPITQVTKSYEYGRELLGLLLRILITVGLEVAVALLFRLNEKKQLLCILLVNIGTQLFLNLLLFAADYYDGPLMAWILFVLAELAVFVLETVLYVTLLRHLSVRKRRWWVYLLYALAANAVSLAAGVCIYLLWASIFG